MSNIKKVQIGENIYDIDSKSVDGHSVEQTGVASNTTTLPTTAQVKAYVDEHSGSSGYSKSETDTLLSNKQDTLVSGTNIKTINNNSILGNGDLSINDVGIIELSSTSGTLTDAQYAEALKPYCIIKYTISEGYPYYFIKLYEAPTAINFDYITKGYTNSHFAILRKYCQISKTNKTYNIYNDNLLLYSASEADEVFKPDFVNTEYNKTLNLVNTNFSYTQSNVTLSISGSSMTLTGTNSGSSDLYFNVNLFANCEVGKTYTLKFYSSSFSFYNNFYDSWIDGEHYWTNTNGELTLTMTDSIKNGAWRFVIVSGSYNNTFSIMLNEGSTALSYVEYGGERIAHIGDLKPVLLWENGNPNSSFSAQTIYTSSPMNDFTYIIIGYKTNMNSTQAIQYEKVKYAKGHIFQIYNAWAGGTYSYSREFRFDSEYSTLMYIYPGYKEGNTYDNERIIPVVIYGTNVL